MRRASALLAVSALVLLSIATASTVAYAAPNPPTVDQLFPDPWITDSTQPAVQGNMDLGVVQIDVESSTDGVSYAPYCTVATPPSASIWFCNTPTGNLSLGINYLRAVATDSVPATSSPGSPITITVVNTPTITSPADDLYTSDYQPTFSGTAELTSFDVTTTDLVTPIFCNTATVVNSAWNCTTTTIPDGDYTYRVSTTYLTNTIYSAPRTIHIDTVSPAAPSINVISGPVDSSPGAPISGSAEENATIDLLVDGASVPCNTGPIDYTGYWSCTLPDGISAGTHTLTAFQTDLAGNISTLSAGEPFTVNDTTPPVPPVVTSPIGTVAGGANLVLTNNATPTVTGTGEPGATLDVVGNTCMIVPTIVDSGGNWSCELTTPMTPDGSYDVHFGQTDAALNSSALTSPYLSFLVDTLAPGTPGLSSPIDSWDSYGFAVASTTNRHPVITGYGEDWANIQIYRDGSFPVACLESPLVSAGESGFTCTVSSALSYGVHDFSFAQTDRAGNSSGSPYMVLRLTVLAPPPPPPPAPLPTFVVSWLLQFQTDGENPTPGQNVTLTGSALPPAPRSPESCIRPRCLSERQSSNPTAHSRSTPSFPTRSNPVTITTSSRLPRSAALRRRCRCR